MSAARPLHVCVPLTHALHARNFVASGCLERLARRGHRVTIVTAAGLRDEIEQATRAWPVPPGVEALEPMLPGPGRRTMRTWTHVASFVHRRRFRTYGHKLRMNARLTSPMFALRAGVSLLMDRIGDVEAFWAGVEALVPPRHAARAFLSRLAPDVLFTPTLIHDGRETELVKAARALGITTVGFAATWDTLTSKGAFYARPDHLFVWGEHNRRHAVEHHGFAPDRIHVTGAPHFDVYGPEAPCEPRDAFLRRRGIDENRRVLLFAGTTVTYWEDEPRLLRALSTAIEQGELKDCVIWYRPHPRRPLAEVADVVGLPHVVLDDQVERCRREGRPVYSTRAEDLPHYRALMNAVDGVVTAFSTMIVEAALLGKPSLVIAFGVDAANVGRLMQHAAYEHSAELLATPGVTLCHDLETLEREIHRILGGDHVAVADTLRAHARAIARNADGGARDRIVAALEAVAAGAGRS